MALSRDDRIEPLEERLKSAYARQPVPPVSRSWREGVMGDVLTLSRKMMAHRPSPEEQLFSLSILYRFAGICGMCAVLSMVLFLAVGGSSNPDISRLLLGDPLGILALVMTLP